jgi:hypothetical protein
VLTNGTLIMFTSLWQRVLIVALLVLPLLLIVVLSAPAFLSWPFLSEKRRASVLELVRLLIGWIEQIGKAR